MSAAEPRRNKRGSKESWACGVSQGQNNKQQLAQSKTYIPNMTTRRLTYLSKCYKNAVK